jgi:membrane protein
MTRTTNGADQGRGRGAATPSQIPISSWRDILWRTWEQISADRILLVAAGVTFYVLLAMVPALVSFITLYGLFFDPADISRQVAGIQGIMPADVVAIIRDQTTRIASQSGRALGLTFAISLAVSMWSATAGIRSIIDALNVAYDEEEKRSFLSVVTLSFVLMLGAIVFLTIMFAGIAVVPLLLNWIGLGGATSTLINVGRWPLLVLVLLAALAVLYRYGPSRERARWRWITWGSGFAAIGWLVFSGLFSWYLANFGNYNETYGSLGAVIAFMTWLWLSATIILVGAELNAEIEHQTARDTTTGQERPIGERGARMADTVGEPRH